MADFDPTYGYTLGQLLAIEPPPQPDNFAAFWRSRYRRAMQVEPQPVLSPSDLQHDDYVCQQLGYRSTDGISIGGWLLTPKHGVIKRGVVIGHGYGGRDTPDFDLPIADAALLFPCFRGLSRSRCWPISDNPSFHVLHDIDKRDHYILGGCVDDLWVAVTVLLQMFPQVAGHVAYLGISFGGGIGALALAWEQRVQRAHFNVPTFGHHPLRLQLPTRGSAAAVQQYYLQHRHVLDILSYYDAASAAQDIPIPLHVAAALADPVVAPPGQFAIYNAVPGEKKLFVFDMGHAEFPRQHIQRLALISELHEFFSDL